MHKYLRIAQMGLFLGGTVFGGVASAYPIVRERAADLGDISGEEVDALYALAVFFPGPSFMNLWGSVCARAGGMLGAFIGQVCLLLPAFSLVMVLPLLSQIPWIAGRSAGAFNGAVWSTVGLMIATGVENFRKQKSAGARIMAGVGLAALFLGMHPTVLLVLMIAGGVGYSLMVKPEGKVA